MKALTFEIRTLEPLLLAQPSAGEENSAISYDYVPGAALRAALIARYRLQHPGVDVVTDPACRKLFFDGAVRYLHAYPRTRLGRRALPVALSWHVNKDERDALDATVYDLACGQAAQLSTPTKLPGPFCWLDHEEKTVELFNAPRQITVHNASQDRSRKEKSNSTVFRYEAIEPGRRFVGAIIAEDDQNLNWIADLMDANPIMHLGRSRGAGYGRVSFEQLPHSADWQEYPRAESIHNGFVVVTLLSDAILYDEKRAPVHNLDTIAGSTHIHAFARTRIAGGFNRKWGLPLTQDLALQAGSVFVYEAAQVDDATLQDIVTHGIGGRRVEGFGRIAVNWHRAPKLARRQVRSPKFSTGYPLSPESKAVAWRLAQRYLRTRLDAAVVRMVRGLSIESPPSNAQLGRLRLAARRALQAHSYDPLLQHLKNLRPASRQQLAEAQVGGSGRGTSNLLEWLQNGGSHQAIWNELEPDQMPAVAGVTATISPPLKVEYTMRVLDALLQRTMGERQSSGGQS